MCLVLCVWHLTRQVMQDYGSSVYQYRGRVWVEICLTLNPTDVACHGQNFLVLSLMSSMLKQFSDDIFYLMMHSTHFYLRLYGFRHMVKTHLDSEPAAITTQGILSD